MTKEGLRATRLIEPDTRDWADVLERGCGECGFTGTEAVASVPAFARTSVAEWESVLTRDDASVRRVPGRWSDVEYAAHVRDILDLFHRRTTLILTEDEPTLPNFDGDAVAIASDYGNQEPAAVLTGLQTATHSYADTLSKITDGQWERTGSRADGHLFTLTSLTRYGFHEMRHHRHDVGV